MGRKMELQNRTSLLPGLFWLKLNLALTFLCKSKAIPVTGLGGLKGCEMLRIPHCLDNRLTDDGNVVSPTHRPHFTPQNPRT
jgi:hypothetical protein